MKRSGCSGDGDEEGVALVKLGGESGEAGRAINRFLGEPKYTTGTKNLGIIYFTPVTLGINPTNFLRCPLPGSGFSFGVTKAGVGSLKSGNT